MSSEILVRMDVHDGGSGSHHRQHKLHNSDARSLHMGPLSLWCLLQGDLFEVENIAILDNPRIECYVSANSVKLSRQKFMTYSSF